MRTHRCMVEGLLRDPINYHPDPRRLTEHPARFRGTLPVDASSVFQRRLHGEKEDEYAETERGLHEAGDPQRDAVRGRWREADAADRGHQETVGLHQEER